MNITIYHSSGEAALFVQKKVEQLTPLRTNSTCNRVIVDEDKLYQTMDGFGASFTDSAAYLIHQVLEPEQRASLMRKLFDPEEGIGLSVLRNPMGASDYAREIYSYNDLAEGQTDLELANFSIAHDEEDIIPLLAEATSLNPKIKLMASPWSPPGWMKTSGSMIGGVLKPECYGVYGEYFVRYIQAYAERGLNIYAITPQNEALYSPGHYPGMLMLPEEQIEFIKYHLKPALLKHNLHTKIFCYDHNWDEPNYPRAVLEQAYDEVDGIAWHWYGGDPSAQSELFEAFPNKEVHFTEGSGGEWIPPFEEAFSNVMRTGIEILRNHSQSFILWNMALDEQNGPTVPGFGKSTCRGVVTINQQTKALTYTLDYYALAHFSKCIRPGARRLGASTANGCIRTVAFKNPDQSLAIVMFNDSEAEEGITLALKEHAILSFALEPKSAITIFLK